MNYTYNTPYEAGTNLTQGADKFFVWIIGQDIWFMNYFYLMLWAIIFIGGSFTEKKLTSMDSFIKWAFLASFITFALSTFVTFTTDINTTMVSFVTLAALILFGAIWFSANKVIKA